MSSQAQDLVPPMERRLKVAIVLLAGAVAALSLGVYGKVHDPTGDNIFTLFFTATLNMKAWFATIAMFLGLFQIVSALRLFDKVKIPRQMPSWLPVAHRISGYTAFLLTIPVAYHCLWSLGFQQGETRQLVHSLAGCFFYGAFVSKVVVVRSKGLPGWLLPLVGGSLFTGLVVAWATSALWFFQTVGFPEV